jgi:PAP2 superfamily
MAARLKASPTGLRAVTAPAPARRAGLAWPRLPAAAELATIAAGYAAYSLVRLAIRASRQAAFAHADQLWRSERRLHLTAEPYLNHLAAAHSVFAEAAGYYYGLAHFLITPLVLAWLYLRRPAAFPQLRSALVLATAAANVVFWVWPAAPPRFSVPGMTDILVTRDILGAAHPHGATSLVNLYAAMPSLHVAWAAWCALAVITATRGWWRHLAWFYPAATTLVVLASANHFLLDAVGGIAVAGLGMLATSRPAVTFSRRRRGTAQPAMAGWPWMAVDGLSGAAAIGLYTTAWRPVGFPGAARHLTRVKTRREPR